MANFTDISALEASGLAEKLNKDDSLWWVVVNVDASESGAKPKAVVGATGDTNLDGLKAQLRDDAMQFGCFKVLGVDTKGAVTSTRLKLVTFQWVGPKTPKMHVMKVKPAKQGVTQYFQGAHLTLELYHLEDLSEEDIEARLRAAGGAHQPDRFAFGTGSTIAASEPPAMPSAPSVPSLSAPPAAAAAAASAPAPAPATSPRPAEASPTSSSSSSSASASASASASGAAAPADKQANNMFASMSRQASSSSGMVAKPAAAVAVKAAAGGKREPFTMTFNVPDEKRAELIAALQAGNDLSLTLYC